MQNRNDDELKSLEAERSRRNELASLEAERTRRQSLSSQQSQPEKTSETAGQRILRQMNPFDVSGNLAAGMAQGVYGTAKMLSNATPANMGASLIRKIAGMQEPELPKDVYNLFGKKNESFTTPQGAIQSAGELMSLGDPGVGLIKKGLPKTVELYNYLRPSKAIKEVKSTLEKNIADLTNQYQEKSKNIVSKLSHGSTNSEENAASLANDIRKRHDASEENVGSYFKHVLGQAGKENIYPHVDPLITTAMDQGKQMMERVKDINIGPIYDKFKKSPTLENAHNLKQELGLMIGDLKKIPGKSAAERDQLNSLKNTYDKLNDDMLSHLKRRDLQSNENLAPMWQKGVDLFKEQVEPYISNKKLREINRGRKKYVKNIHQAFENPDAADIVNRDGSVTPGSGTKLLNDLPEHVKNKILFSKIGTPTGDNLSKLAKSIETAGLKGYSQYIPKSLKDSIHDALTDKNHIETLKENAKNEIEKLKERKSNMKARAATAATIGLPLTGTALLGHKIFKNLSGE